MKFHSFLLILYLGSAHAWAQKAESSINIKNDGIIRIGEDLSSPIFQSHGQNIDPTHFFYNSSEIRKYVRAGTDSLRYLPATSNVYLPLDLDLRGSQKCVGYESVTRRYDLGKPTVTTYPKYKRIYETYYADKYVKKEGTGTPSRVIRDPNSSSGTKVIPGKPPVMIRKRVKLKRLIEKRKIGTRTIEVPNKIYHENGQYSETVHMPIYEGINKAYVANGWYATNAQVLFSLIKNGIDPRSKQLSSSISELTSMLIEFGLPDGTEDLAWIAALYSNYPNAKGATKMIQDGAIAKLISGGKPMGKLSGMWGPICLNPAYAQLLRNYDTKFVDKHLSKLVERQNELKSKVGTNGRKRDIKNLQDLEQKMIDNMELYAQISRQYKLWCLSAKVMFDCRSELKSPSSSDGVINGIPITHLHIPGLYYNAFKYFVTDINSTAIALFALKEAKNNNLMPEYISGPKDEKGEALSRSKLHTEVVLRRTLSSLMSLQKDTLSSENAFSIQEHSACKKVVFTHQDKLSDYSDIQPRIHGSNSYLHYCSLIYLHQLIDDVSNNRLDKLLSKTGETILNNLKNDIISAPQKFTRQSASHLYFLQDIMSYRRANRRDWSSIGMALLPHFIDSLSFKKYTTSVPEVVQSLIDAEKNRAAKAKEPISLGRNSISYASMAHRTYSDLTWKAAFIDYLQYKPHIHTFSYWDPSGQFRISKALKNTITVFEKRGQNRSFSEIEKELEIHEIYLSPFLIIDPDVARDQLQNNREVLKEYLLNHRGTIVFAQGSNSDTQKNIEALFSDWNLKYESFIDLKMGKEFLCLGDKNTHMPKYAISIPIGNLENEDKTNLYQISKALYKLAPTKDSFVKELLEMSYNEDFIKGKLTIPVELDIQL